MAKIVSKAISVITVAPLLSLFCVTYLFIIHPESFGEGIIWYTLLLLTLTVIPISAYPLARSIPKIKIKGRNGERNLAFITCGIGYTLGAVLALVFKAPEMVRHISIAYFLCVFLLTFVNKVIKVRASGHACSIAGPCTILFLLEGWPFLFTFLLLPLVFWSRLKLKRHTPIELFLGASIGILCTFIATFF